MLLTCHVFMEFIGFERKLNMYLRMLEKSKDKP
jgi:hypothetical protein